MQTFTWGTTPEDVIREALPHKYSMELNRSDMLMVLRALAEYGDNRSDVTVDPLDTEDRRDNAMSLRSCILETVDIEEV